jgi:hypothetical protein
VADVGADALGVEPGGGERAGPTRGEESLRRPHEAPVLRDGDRVAKRPAGGASLPDRLNDVLPRPRPPPPDALGVDPRRARRRP